MAQTLGLGCIFHCMGTFLLSRAFCDGWTLLCRQNLWSLLTEHRFLNVLLLIVTFESPALYSVCWSLSNTELLENFGFHCGFFCRRLLLTDARLFLQIDIFNYTSCHLFYRAEFLMSSEEKLTHLKAWRSVTKEKKKPFPSANLAALSWRSVLFSHHTLCSP